MSSVRVKVEYAEISPAGLSADETRVAFSAFE